MTDPDKLGPIFFALSDPLRRRVLEAVAARPGATVTEVCAGFEVSRFAIMRHLNVLEDAGLVSREAVGRERHVRLSEQRFEDALSSWVLGLRKDGK